LEAAVVAYVESELPARQDGPEFALVVRDLESGVERCDYFDLDGGESEPCA
jgi:hypothetical protein